jgi:hypothetical protein
MISLSQLKTSVASLSQLNFSAKNIFSRLNSVLKDNGRKGFDGIYSELRENICGLENLKEILTITNAYPCLRYLF